MSLLLTTSRTTRKSKLQEVDFGGSSRKLFDEISSMIDRLEERSTNGETGQKNINIWCLPCSRMLMTAETITAYFSRGTEERVFTINVHPRMPAGCCKYVPVRTLVQKMHAITHVETFCTICLKRPSPYRRRNGLNDHIILNSLCICIKVIGKPNC